MYNFLKESGSRALYFDSDSVVLTSVPCEWEPLGDYLGDLTNEVSDNNITHFVTSGPKIYAYKAMNPNKVSIGEVRDITVNFKNSLDINYRAVRDTVTGNGDAVGDNKIVRNPATGHDKTKLETKDYTIVFEKRFIVNNYQSMPYDC